jgi:hypothetical protein
LSWAAATPTIASTAEAEAGTNNTNFITPLRMREGFNAGGSAPVYACRAWVNFDGTTSPGTIRGSGNVSSVTRNATGVYTVNFSTAMPDTNYSVGGIGGTGSDSPDSQASILSHRVISTGSFKFQLVNHNDTLIDRAVITLQFFR